MDHPFELNEIVCLRSDPAARGPIIAIVPGEPETRYTVWHGDAPHPYYASQLLPITAPPAGPETVPLDRFRAHLTALQLLHPSLASLYSLHAARISFIPYQFRPVLKFVRADRPRLLIADEVGVGKTIEAGLILRELQARREVRSVLIICPKALVADRKWERELKRFDESFATLTGDALRYCVREADLDGEWPEQYSRAIVPFSLLGDDLLEGDGAERKGLLHLDPPPRFDLIICDEAHAIRNTDTQLHRAVRFLCENADAVVFLTATPIQLHNRDLFVLLNVLRPDTVRDQATFERMAEPNPHLNRAVAAARDAQPGWEGAAADALRDALATDWGRVVLAANPAVTGELERLNSPLDAPERLAFIRRVEEFHTFAQLINRTRRRDIGAFTTRSPETVSIEFTPAQRELHDGLLAVQAGILANSHDPRSVAFLMTTIRRQAASCIHGLAPFLHEMLARRNLDQLAEDFESDGLEIGEIGDVLAQTGPIEAEIRSVLGQAEALGDDDPKREALLRIIAEKQGVANNKLLVFSAFLHTLHYLHQHVASLGVRCRVIHGGVADDERQDLRHRFSLPRTDPHALDVLLSSEVGCEGLDYQFCDGLVNYDIPWNPMRIEQRIGRIDRFGQESEKILIYNFITPGTVEAEIYERCLLRIGIFQQSIGGTEEILGQIAQRIQSIAENLQLTDRERQERLQQLGDNEIRVRQEQQALEEREKELFGISLPPGQAEADVRAASSPWLGPAALDNLVRAYLGSLGAGESVLGERTLKTLRTNQDVRQSLLADLRALNLRPSAVHREWERWLKGNQPTLGITFDDAAAADNRGTAFIMPVHPLAQQAARAMEPRRQIASAFRVRDPEIPAGTYAFAIYQWRRNGIGQDVGYRALCEIPMPTERFLELLDLGVGLDPFAVPPPAAAILADLDRRHYREWVAARAEHQEETRRVALYRLESLRTSHRMRMAGLQERLARTTDERVRRIPQGEMAAAEADFARQQQQIELAEGRADILAQLVAVGTMIVDAASDMDASPGR